MNTYRRLAGETTSTTTGVIAATSTEARDGMIIDVPSMRLDNYNANPVVLWAHRSDQLPIGTAQVTITDGTLRAEITWDSAELAQEVARLFDEQVLNAVSIGWRPGRVVPRKELAEDDPYYLDSDRYSAVVHYDCDLLEISAVPVPADAGALADRGIGVCVRSGLPLPGEQGGALDELLAAIRDEFADTRKQELNPWEWLTSDTET